MLDEVNADSAVSLEPADSACSHVDLMADLAAALGKLTSPGAPRSQPLVMTIRWRGQRPRDEDNVEHEAARARDTARRFGLDLDVQFVRSCVHCDWR